MSIVFIYNRYRNLFLNPGIYLALFATISILNIIIFTIECIYYRYTPFIVITVNLYSILASIMYIQYIKQVENFASHAILEEESIQPYRIL